LIAVDARENARYLLRPAEVAELLGVSRSWLYAAVQTGRIPSLRLGGADGPVRFRPQELDEWIADSRVARTPVNAQSVHRPPTEERVEARRPTSRSGLADGAQLRLLLSSALHTASDHPGETRD
jgi:excisionase family DNA binding protein